MMMGRGERYIIHVIEVCTLYNNNNKGGMLLYFSPHTSIIVLHRLPISFS